MPLTWLDVAALVVFSAAAFGWATLVDRVASVRARSVMAAMDAHRARWMLAVLDRDNRIVDAAIIGNLMNSTSFLATTSIFILGGLVAMLGASDLGARVVSTLPYAAAPDPVLWEVKILLLLVIFVAAFFELTWALRQFNYASILIGGLPLGSHDPGHVRSAEVAARVLNRAARHYTNGLRGYYFGLAALGWLVHPVALIAASLFVLRELHRREFQSVVRETLAEKR